MGSGRNIITRFSTTEPVELNPDSRIISSHETTASKERLNKDKRNSGSQENRDKDSENYLYLLEQINIPILMLTGDLRISFFSGNRSFLRLNSADTGRHIREVDLGLDCKVLEDTVLEVFHSRDCRHITVQDKEGRRIIVRVHPTLDQHKDVSGAVVAFIETGEFKSTSEAKEPREKRLLEDQKQKLIQLENKKQEAEAASKGKDEFLAVLSHELRTPLHAMLGWTRLLKRKKLDKKTYAKCVEVLEQSVSTQAKLIDDMLDISRISSGKINLEKTFLDLKDLLEKVVDFMQPQAEAKNLAISTELAELKQPCYGDPERIRQVIRNLLSNAIKFTPQGQSVKIALKKNGLFAEIEVSDTGAGIDSEFLPFIFEPFRQADSSSSRSHGGLGLGLSIAKHIVEMHGGIIEAKSSGEGQGAVFTVLLPMAGKPGAIRFTTTEGDKELSLKNRCLKGLRVLLVDDDNSGREVFALALNKWGARIITAASAKEGLKSIMENDFDIVVSDVGMPVADGYFFLKQIRALPNEEKRQLPVIALTAYARAGDSQKLLDAGFERYVSKPMEPAVLAQTILSVLREGKAVL